MSIELSPTSPSISAGVALVFVAGDQRLEEKLSSRWSKKLGEIVFAGGKIARCLALTYRATHFAHY